MTRLVVTSLVVVLVWAALTTVAAWAVPARSVDRSQRTAQPALPAAGGGSTGSALETGPSSRRHVVPTSPRPVARSAPTPGAVATWLRAVANASTTTTTVTTTTVRAQPAARRGYGPGVEPGGEVDPACLTGTRKASRAESDRCWRPLVDDYAWNVETALAVIWCESGGDESAVNRIGATGLFQLFDGSYDGAPYPGGLDPVTNVRIAYEGKYLTGRVGFLEDWISSARCW